VDHQELKVQVDKLDHLALSDHLAHRDCLERQGFPDRKDHKVVQVCQARLVQQGLLAL